VFEKSAAPVQKIGESTLSSFSRFTNGAILHQDYFFRLFGLKDGLQFYCIDRHGLSVTSEDIGGLDLSFQLDRRMSELFLTMWAQKMGIHVYHGVDVDFKIGGDDVFGTSTNPYDDANAEFLAYSVQELRILSRRHKWFLRISSNPLAPVLPPS
jgi:hypothetical protein